MIAARALMNLTAQAAYLELCLSLGRPISAVRVNIRRRIGFVQKPIEFLTVMHARVGHVILPNQLVPGIGIHVVLVSIETLAVLLGPARILVFLPVFRRIFLPGPGRLAGLHILIFVTTITLFGNRNNRRINHLVAASGVALRFQMLAKTLNISIIRASFGTRTIVRITIWPPRAAVPFGSKLWPKPSNSFSMRPAFASVSRNNQSVVPSGMLSSMPSRRNRVNDRRSRT